MCYFTQNSKHYIRLSKINNNNFVRSCTTIKVKIDKKKKIVINIQVNEILNL